MKRSVFTRPFGVILLVFGMIAFGASMLVTSGELNTATLRSIDGPLNAQQLASLRLCDLLNIAASSLICGATLTAIFLVKSRSGRIPKVDLTP